MSKTLSEKPVKFVPKRGLTSGSVKIYSNQTLIPSVVFNISKVGSAFADAFTLSQSAWSASEDIVNFPWETTITATVDSSKPWPIGDNQDIEVELRVIPGTEAFAASFHVILTAVDPSYITQVTPITLTYS